MHKIKIALLYLFYFMALPYQIVAQKFDMADYCTKNATQNNEDFFINFPYQDYLKKVAFTDFKTIEQHRVLLQQQKGIGDDFIYHLGDKFTRIYPVKATRDQLNAKISIGEMYIKKKPNISLRDNETYQIVGYFVLGLVARRMEKEISAGNFDISDPENEKIITRLSKNKVYLTMDKSSWDKTMDALKKGNFNYILDRFKKKFEEYTNDNQQVTKLSLKNFTYKKHPSVEIFSVAESATNIGYAVWMPRTNVKVSYFAHGAVQTKFNSFKNSRGASNVVLATTGGFTNVNKQPEGLTVENGQIVNAVLLPERHGLVIVEKDGNLRVINIKNAFTLPNMSKSLNPLDNLLDYSALVNWCKSNRATVFQTQLLAHDNQQLIQIGKAANQLRERRILAVTSDGSGTSNVIFHITASKNLAVITEEVFELLKARGKRVEAILNLDVGSYNILEVRDANGKIVNAVKGTVPMARATNLILFYK